MIHSIFKTIKMYYNKVSIRSAVFASFTLSSVLVILFIGISLYSSFSKKLDANVQEEKQILINQVNVALNSHLRNMMRVSDALYYSVIKNADIRDESINENMRLIFDVNMDDILNIALFDADGNLVKIVPAANIKDNYNVTNAEWFKSAMNKTENLHFFLPSVQNIYVDIEYNYQWVVSLSQAVEITKGNQTEQGILLIDMKYGGIEQILKNTTIGTNGYIYLMDSEGNIIYHPKQQLIAAGLCSETNVSSAKLKDGNYEEVFNGEKRMVSIKSVGYTGWKIVGITKEQNFSINDIQNKVFVATVFFLFIMILALMNWFISSKITNPIKMLEQSVEYVEGTMNEDDIFIGGSYEVTGLGKSIKKMVGQMQKLMGDIVTEHGLKRKSELDALQSQINPHFLYNTLDIIVWMVENEQKVEAVRVITALARFFRISLSKGQNIITVADELEHVRNYLTIQDKRFKNKFVYTIEAEPETLNLTSIKLILQPIVENAIYHGMEFMDGDGFIHVNAYIKTEFLYMVVKDNGLGMTQQTADSLLDTTVDLPVKPDNTSAPHKGSGIGLRNIQERIQLYYGKSYGLAIESEPDVGTTITMRLPIIPIEQAEKE